MKPGLLTRSCVASLVLMLALPLITIDDTYARGGRGGGGRAWRRVLAPGSGCERGILPTELGSVLKS